MYLFFSSLVSRCFLIEFFRRIAITDLLTPHIFINLHALKVYMCDFGQFLGKRM